jgi:hypothetical protein
MAGSTLPNKGDLVAFKWFQTKLPLASLAGMQPKVTGDFIEVSGHVAHVRGDHPSEPTQVGIWLRADDALKGAEGIDRVLCPKCGREEIGPMDLAYVVDVLQVDL